MNLLITGAWQQAADFLSKIIENHEVVFLQFEEDDIPCDPEWVEGIIGNGIFLFHPIERFTNLRFIQLISAGYDRVPMEYVSEHAIKIFNARGVYSIPMAEFAVAGVLQLYKEMRGFMELQNVHHWEKIRTLRELSGKNIVIIGCGSVGTECAKRFKAFDTTVIGVDIYSRKNKHYDIIKNLSELEKVLKYADIIVITVPLTEKTKWLFNSERISIVKDGAILVNIARGAVVKTDSLVRELKTGRIGAVLDVFEEEPVDKDSILWEMKNVILTPHNSFVGEGNGKRLSNVIMKNLEGY